jgi:hypothetical protein
MTLAEIHASVTSAKAQGHEHMLLTIARKRPPRYWDDGRVWRGGPRCRFIGETEPGRWLVDVKIADLEPALDQVDPGLDAATDHTEG